MLMFSKGEKKKKGPALAISVGALAVYGAYSAVQRLKNMTVDKVSCLMSKMKKGKDKKSCDCGADGCECDEG